jgi:TonB-linked SusC/RagA family outer membrane protein
MRVIKLTAFIIFITFWNVHAMGWSQTVTISEKNAPIQKIFKAIFSQTGISFVYNEKIFENFSPVTIDVKDVPIQKVLDECLKNKPYFYTFEDKTISIHKTADIPAPSSRDIHGHVTDSLGKPLARASVTVKGVHKGTFTDASGDFDLKDVGEDVTLVISYTGYATREVRTNGQQAMNIQLREEFESMNNVVVTALGIERQSKSLGFSTQRVKGEEFEDTKDLNLANAMIGKVAGLEINGSTEMFISSDIRLRGVTPLIVVDGAPINTTTWDLNYNDIESIDVLKGPTAAGLYGSAGINGAVVISLKKGKSNKTTVEFTSTNMVQPSLLTSPKVQTEYGSGAGGKYQYQNGTGTALEGGGFTWGPRLDGRPIIQWNSPIDPSTGQRTATPWLDHSGGKGNLVKFLQTGFMTANNLNFETGNDRGSFRISMTQEYQKGIVPNTRMNIYGFSVGGRYQFSKNFEVNTSLNYSKQYSPNYRVPGYGANDYIYSLSFWLGNDIDLQDSRNYWVPGAVGTQQRFAQSGYYNNPYFLAYENLHISDKDAIYGQISGNLTFIPKELSLKVRVGANTNSLTAQQHIPVNMTGTPLGNFTIADTRNFTINNDAILSYNKKVSENFSVDAIAGVSYFYTKQTVNTLSTSGLVIPLFYSMSNSLNPGTILNTLAESQKQSVYANVDLKFWKPIYLSLTGRNDWVSTLPLVNNSYFYPSAALSVVFSDWLTLPQAVSFLKIRSSIAQVNTGNTGSTYGQVQTYPVGVYNNMPTMQVSRSLIPSGLLPSASRTYEFGGNIAFFKNRLSLDATYFNRLDYNNIISQSVSITTGYNSVTANGRRYNTRGLELALSAVPVKTQDFRWDLNVNFYKGHKYLKALENGLTQDGYIKLGSRVDQIYMYPWLKDPSGNLILASGTGLAQQDGYMRYTGNYDPDFIYGLQTHFKYKSLTLGLSFDGRKGGMYFSILPRMVRAGTSPDYDPKAREDAANGLSNYVGKGVVVVSGSAQYDGLGNITADTRKYAANTTATSYESWEKTIGNMSGNRAESFLHADYLKLREVSLSWTIPQKVFGKFKVSSGEVSFFGSNLLIFTRKSSLGDDPSWLIGEGTVDSDLKSPTARSFGVQLKLKF